MAEERGRTSAIKTITMGKLTAKIFRSKTKKKVALAVISPNGPEYVSRRKQPKTSISSPCEGKENTPLRSSRQRLHNDEDKQLTEATKGLNESKQSHTRQKRDGSTDPSPLSGLREEGKGSRWEDKVAWRQTSTPVGLRKEGFLPAVKNLQIADTADACSLSEDGKQSGAPVEKADEHQLDFPECFDERRLAACSSSEKNMVAAKLAGVPGSKAPVVLTVRSPAEESKERLSSDKRRAPTKTYKRRATREGITSSVPNSTEQPSGRDQDGVKSADYFKFSNELQETIDCATEKMRTSRSSNENQQRLTRKKRVRSTDPSSLSGLHGDGNGSRLEDSVAGSQTSVLVRVVKEEGFVPDDNNIATNLQIMDTADACTPSEDGIQSGAPVCTARKRQPDCSECPAEQQTVACRSRDERMVSAELAPVAGSKPPVVLTIQSAGEESEERLDSGRKTAQAMTYARRASRKSITTSVPNFPEQRSSRDHEDIKWAEFCKSDELQETIARATDTLQDAYNKLYRKYKNLKTRQLADAAEAFDEQSRRIEVFSRAADDLVQNLRTKNSVWDLQEEMLNSSRAMEVAYNECRNDLVIERARSLELRQRLEHAELRGSKLLHDLLENTTQLTISDHGKSEIVFSHNQSGYEFTLEQNKVSEEVGGKNALLYNVVSPGTILHTAPEWMQTEVVFDMTQALVFFRRIAVALRGGASV